MLRLTRKNRYRALHRISLITLHLELEFHYIDLVKKVFNHEPHEKARKFFIRFVASTDGIAHEFVTWPIAFSDGSDRSDGSAMLELALKGRDIPAQGNALGSDHPHQHKP
jgi:hypothetical protein